MKSDKPALPANSASEPARVRPEALPGAPLAAETEEQRRQRLRAAVRKQRMTRAVKRGKSRPSTRAAKRKRGAPRSTQQPRPLVEMAEWFVRHAALHQSGAYDGVHGKLPDWIPDSLRRQFEEVRKRLADSYNPGDVLRWMSGRRTDVETHRWEPYPPDLSDQLDTLIQIQSIHDLGPEKGLKEHLGENAEKALTTANTRKAADARYEQNRQAKDRARELWRTGVYASKEAAVKDIIRIIRNEFSGVLSDDDEKARGRVLDWLVRKDKKRAHRTAKKAPS